jgi:hypothetical protein
MGTKPVHTVLGLVFMGCALASGCRSDNNGGGGSPGMIGSNTPRSGAFGRDPGGVNNAPSSQSAAAGGQSPNSVYGNQQNPMTASSASSPAAGRAYPNGNVVSEDGSVASRQSGWTGSPRSNTVIPASATGSASGNVVPAGGLGAGTSAGVTPANFQQPMPAPAPGANGYPSPATSAAAFPGGDPGAFRGQPGFSPAPAPASNNGSTMTFSPGTTSGDVGRTPAPEVEGAPPGGQVYNVPGKAN